MVVEFFFMTKAQPHRCYLVLSVVLIIIILLSPFNTFTSNDGKVTTLSYSPEWSYWPYNGFYSDRFSQVRNKHTRFKTKNLEAAFRVWSKLIMLLPFYS